MTQEEFLKNIVRLSEERFIWYKKQFEIVHKDKISFPLNDGLTDWYKEFLRDSKNSEEYWLKKNRDELTDLRQGMNPSFCYNYKRKSSN